MQKSYSGRLANYIGPESCGISGNIDSEALTGVRAVWVTFFLISAIIL
jgi:hypothetical protein